MNSQQRHKGFTIVELLIVIVIIGILAAITVVAFNGMQNRARASEAIAGTSQAKKKLEVYKAENGSYPVTGGLSSAGISDGSVTYQYTSDGSTFCITSTSGTSSFKASDTTGATAGGCAGHAQGGKPLLTNMVRNPSFETNSSTWGWANGNGYSGTVSTDQSHSGSRSFAISGGPTAQDNYLETYVDNVPPGTYTYISYVYFTGQGDIFQNRQAAWFHCSIGGPCTDPPLSYNPALLNQWQRIQKTITVSATSNFRLRFYAPTNSTTYFDSVMVIAGSTAYDYKDGNSADWAWTGAVNNSTSIGPTP